MPGAHPDRRSFLRGRLSPDYLVRPPWTRENALRDACTACGACVEACPQNIIALGNGLPVITFTDECTACGRCADACEEPIFDRALAPFPHVAAISPGCFAVRGIVCQSCGDACPEMAIRFDLRMGGPALPSIHAERCTGCGACIAACPADAIISARKTEAAIA